MTWLCLVLAVLVVLLAPLAALGLALIAMVYGPEI